MDGAQSSQTAAKIIDPNPPYWNTPLMQLKDAGVTPAQVQVIWLKEADMEPKEPFPAEVKKLQAELVTIVHHLRDKFPNTKMIYISPRIYGGYSVRPLNPEPHAYETGFAVKWLIADQIAGQPGAELRSRQRTGARRVAGLGAVPLGGRREAEQGRTGVAARGSQSRRRASFGQGPREGGAAAAGLFPKGPHHGILVLEALNEANAETKAPPCCCTAAARRR